MKVIVGLPQWSSSGQCAFARRLVQGLKDQELDARVLLTEWNISHGLEDQPAGLPDEKLPYDVLPAGRDDSWGMRWEALIRYLEERAPCFYLMLHDWRNNIVASRLSDRVFLIGLIQTDHELDYDQAGRLGHLWNAVVTLSEPLHFALASRFPHLAPRIVTIQDAVPYDIDSMVRKYRGLFERIELMGQSKHFTRPRGLLSSPPRTVAGVDILSADTSQDVAYANASERWPNPPGAATQPGSVTREVLQQSFGPLEHRVIVAIPDGQISGVNTFATHLVRGLCKRGFDARIVGLRLLDRVQSLPLADDLVIDDLGMTDDMSWPKRWKTMRNYLESVSPCFYVPNYDYDFSGIAPRLSARVKVVCIGHSDDPVHFEHCLRIGRASDAVVGVSAAITQFLAVADPTLVPRLHTIPYGIPLPAFRPGQHAREGVPLRIAFVGRLVQHQKRVWDIIAIARLLEERRVPFELIALGDGPDRNIMEKEGSDLIASGRLSFPGKLANAEIPKFLGSFDAFVLPSSFEGLSLSLLEAMSKGIVPVVSDIRSGVPELIRDGVNGFIAPVGDVVRFADHLEYLYNKPAERLRMSIAAYRTIEDGGYRVDDMIDKYVELFRIVAGQPFARQPGPMTPPRQLSGRIWRVKQYLRYPYRKLKRARTLVAKHIHWNQR